MLKRIWHLDFTRKPLEEHGRPIGSYDIKSKRKRKADVIGFRNFWTHLPSLLLMAAFPRLVLREFS